MPSAGEGSVLGYARYATVSDVWAAVREQWAVFPTWAIVLLVLGWFSDRAPDSPPDSSKWGLPDWLFWAVLFALALWLWRGQTFRVPPVSFGEWVAAASAAFVTAAIGKFTPWWLTSVWVAFLAATWHILDRINDFGRERWAEAAAGNGVQV